MSKFIIFILAILLTISVLFNVYLVLRQPDYKSDVINHNGWTDNAGDYADLID